MGTAPDEADLQKLAPNAYAGQWLHRGRLHVAYTDDPARRVAEAQEQIRLSRKVVAVHHRHSLRDLQALRDKIERHASALDAPLTVTDVSVVENHVHASLADMSDPASRALVDAFAGDPVEWNEDEAVLV